jgi:hypothetical protein
MEDRNQVCPTHWKGNNAKCAERGLKSGKILRGLCDFPFIECHI